MDNGEAYGYATDQIVKYAKDRNVDIVVGLKQEDLLLAVQLRTQWELDLHL